MSGWLWRPANLFMRAMELIYQRMYRLQPVGPLLYLQQTRYKGPLRRLDDGTSLVPGQPVAELHFNNRGLRQAQRSGGNHGFVFARLMLRALACLAEEVEKDDQLREVAGFHGITWIPPHGRRIGFEARPLPPTWTNRLRAAYLRLLLYAFNPSSLRRFGKRTQVYEFWLSRKQLLTHFGNQAVRRQS